MQTLSSLVPLARCLPARRRHALGVVLGVLVVAVAALAVHTFVGFGGPGWEAPLRTWGTSLCYVLVAVIVALRAALIPDLRGPWMVVAVGVSTYAAGNVVWELWLAKLADPPIPSISDALWLSLYPASYIGVLWLAREEWRRVRASVWLDGVIAGLGLAAIGAAIVFRPVLDAASGGTVAVATNLAYPIGDLLLAALIMGVFALRGWRPDRRWALLGSGFLTLTFADCLYLLHVASGSLQSSSFANVFYLIGVALLALAAWQPHPVAAAPKLESWSILLIPATFILIAIVLLAAGPSISLDPTARALCILTIFAGFARGALSFGDLRSLAETRMLAVTDELTSLPNRRLFLGRLDAAVEDARGREGSCALLLIDLDHFKELNDTLGHAAGDDLLRKIGPRLSHALRTTDTLARLGGDEFGVVIPAPADESTALAVADKLRNALTAPFAVHDLSLYAEASVGVAVFPQHGETANELLRRADVAMYQAKRAQTGREIYDSSRDTHSRARLSLASELKQGLVREEIEAYFQPKADADTGMIVGMEALARWRHPVNGLVSPNTFVPVAEQAGLSRALTARMLGLALDQCRAWRDAGHDLHVALNVSVADLVDVAFPDQVADAIASRGLPPEALVIEITELSVLSDPIRINQVLARLHQQGVRLALDDFGTGYSSLTHLRTLPVEEVKIDRSFVAHMATDPADAAIVIATIRLAETLGMRVVAEGVEDEDTWRRLASVGCQLIQGYVLSPPAPASELAHLLAAPFSFAARAVV